MGLPEDVTVIAWGLSVERYVKIVCVCCVCVGVRGCACVYEVILHTGLHIGPKTVMHACRDCATLTKRPRMPRSVCLLTFLLTRP